MIAINIRPIEPLPDGACTYFGADIDNLWDCKGIDYATVLVPIESVDANFDVIKHVEHYEIHGSVCSESFYEIKVGECTWLGGGHAHEIINSEAVCWEVENHA
tara:strand:+ start:3630 stop:3938 length:309 start_codon:yes stop_codon:yes gene_type:complete